MRTGALAAAPSAAAPSAAALFVAALLIAVVASSPSAASSAVSIDGLLVRGSAPFAGVVDVHVIVRDALDNELFTDDHASIEVGADGRFTVLLDLAPVLGSLVDGSLDVEVGVVEAGSGAPPVVERARVGASFRAQRATTATTAQTAAVVGGLRAVDGALVTATALVARAALASPGGPAVAWQNLANRPAGVDDGDDGNVVSVGTGLRLQGTTLSLSGVNTSLIVDGTVGSAAIEARTLSTTQIAGLTAADIGLESLKGESFVDGSFESEHVAGTQTPVFQRPLGCALPGALTTSTTCPSVACTTAGQVRRCSDGVCVTGNSVACPTVSLGRLIFAP
jgi:hypothetical protein